MGIDIYLDRIDIVSPGSWLLPKDYNEYPAGSIPSIRRNTIIAACLDVANLMERGGIGFQTMIESYKDVPEEKQPCVMIYPGFLDLRLYDKLYEATDDFKEMTDTELVLHLLEEGPKSAGELQSATASGSRSRFLEEVINPIIKDEKIYRDGGINLQKRFIKSRNSIAKLAMFGNVWGHRGVFFKPQIFRI